MFETSLETAHETAAQSCFDVITLMLVSFSVLSKSDAGSKVDDTAVVARISPTFMLRIHPLSGGAIDSFLAKVLQEFGMGILNARGLWIARPSAYADKG
jgi:hypothetical protein